MEDTPVWGTGGRRPCRFESYWEHQYGEVAQRQAERHIGVAGYLPVHGQPHCVGSSPTLSSKCSLRIMVVHLTLNQGGVGSSPMVSTNNLADELRRPANQSWKLRVFREGHGDRHLRPSPIWDFSTNGSCSRLITGIIWVRIPGVPPHSPGSYNG